MMARRGRAPGGAEAAEARGGRDLRSGLAGVPDAAEPLPLFAALGVDPGLRILPTGNAAATHDPRPDPASAAPRPAPAAAQDDPVPDWRGAAPAEAPDVSIILPARDAAPWLPEALRSLRAQSGLSLEILAVDDGSVDATGALLDAAAAQEGHPLRILSLPAPIGQAGARNHAIAAASGRWIGFLDADDALDGDAGLQAAVAAAEASAAQIVVRQFDVLPRSGPRRPGRRTPAPADGAPTDAAAHPALSEVSSCWQLLIRAEFARKAQLRFDPALRQREDRPFVVSAILAADRVLVDQGVGALHRLRDGSTMTLRDADQFAQFARHLHALAEAMDAAAARRPAGALDAYRAAVETSALVQMLSYWGEVAADPAAASSLRHALRGLARLSGGQGDSPPVEPLLADRMAATGLPAIPAPQDRFAAEGAADLLRALACAGRDAAARRLILDGALPWPALAVERRGLAPAARRAAARALTFDRGRSAPLLRRGLDEEGAAARLAPLTLTLHLGMPKTGSSAFQAWLEENRLELLDRGVLVPVTGRSRARGARRDRSAGHDLLAAALMRGDRSPLRALAGEAALAGGAPEVIVSAETLLGPALWRGPAGLRALRDALPFGRVRAIGLHRDPAVWVERMFREMAANPRNGFTDPPARLLRRLAEAGLTDPDGIRTALEAVFDEVAFERYEDHPDAARRLLTLAGAAPEGLTPPPDRLRNPAVPAAAALNALALKRAGAAPEAIEALAPELLSAPEPGMPEDPAAPLLDMDLLRDALAGRGAPGAPLAAPGCGPRPPSHALLCAALRASGEALERARAAAASRAEPGAADPGLSEPAAPAWLPRRVRAGDAPAGPAAAPGFREPTAALILRPPGAG